jgi:hypothetical protein
MTYDEMENWENVSYRIREEGFHYCFKHYSSFSEIRDEKFHQLRLAYLNAAQELERYVNEKLNSEVDEEE